MTFLMPPGLFYPAESQAVAPQSRQRSRLEPELAGFGILHGLDEKGDLFLPVQATYLSATAVNLLKAFRPSYR